MTDRKITISNREFFLKWLPFNSCDRFCERCEEFRDNCKIYQDDIRFKAQCQIEGKDPYDTKVVFEHVGNIMKDTIKMLREMMEKEGVEITEEDEQRYMKEQQIVEKKVRSQPLYRKCRDFSGELTKFLEDFRNFFAGRPWILASLPNEMEELYFYCSLVSAKIYRALHSQIDEKKDKIKFSRPDSMVSGALGFYSLSACQKSLESVLNLMVKTEKSWVSRIDKLLKIIKETRREFKKSFPRIEKFRDKIIFHGRF